eukprot:12318177-Heterocapsa_arctica.AAC.1
MVECCHTCYVDVFEKCFNSASTVLQQCSNSASAMINKCFKSASKVLQQCFTSASTMFQKCVKSDITFEPGSETAMAGLLPADERVSSLPRGLDRLTILSTPLPLSTNLVTPTGLVQICSSDRAVTTCPSSFKHDITL